LKLVHTLKNKNVLITGAAGGLGKELCLAFGRRGATIIAIDIHWENLQSLKAFLDEKNIECHLFLCDITNKENCRQTVEEIETELHSIDMVVHNAGLSHRSAFMDTKLDVIEHILAVNINGTINLTHYTLNQIVKNKGSYIAISSVAGFAPLIGRTAYAASKHALHGFFETLRVEVEDLGVKVLIVCPSFIKTAMEHTALAGDGRHVSHKKQTVGYVLTPEFVAECIVKGSMSNKKRLYISPIAKLSLWMSRLAPNSYAKIMKKKLLLEIDPGKDRPL
jgi:short-subunit dehydrogenase